MGFPSSAVVKNPPDNAEDMRPGLIPGLGRSTVGNGNPLQHPCLENSMDEEPARLAKSWTLLSTHTHTLIHTSSEGKRGLGF